jgi:quercetin dioxygenase-like cupin family protein
MNPDHTHPVPHAMFVLEGRLVTHKGTFGPNTFVWFPANEVMRHGAGPDEDVLVLFFSDADLRTDYVGRGRRA